MYTSIKDASIAMMPKIESAIMDSKNEIIFYLSHEPITGIEYNLFINNEKATGATIIIRERQREGYIYNLPSTIQPTDLLEVRASTMFLPCKVLMRNYLDYYYYEGNDMGVTFTSESIYLRVWAPTAYKVEIVVYDIYDQEDEKPTKVYKMDHFKSSGTYGTSISRKYNEDKFFLYRLYFKDLDNEGKFIDRITYAVDPYAQAVGVNGNKAALVDISTDKTMPYNWHNDKRPDIVCQEDSILYEMHIRDFTIDKNSGVTQELRGKYLGAVECGTSYYDNISGKTVKTGLDHLKEFGITHVHLLPAYDFYSVDESKPSGDDNRNWGYDPKNFNVPEGSYSTDAFNPHIRIREFREMVKKFHENGIRVIMDMVYNHMFETKNMEKIVQGYYFRTDRVGKFTNGSGCGNEMATERPMVRKFILDSTLHWINNYHIDGVRFDLMELIDLNTMKEITTKVQKIDPAIIIYGEPWRADWSPLVTGTYKGCQRDNNFSIFNDTFRDALRGDNSPSWGFINGDQHNLARAWNVVEGIKGSINGLTSYPKESINYIEAHDNYTIWDQVEKSLNPLIKKGDFRKNLPTNSLEDYKVRKVLLGVGIILTSQGIPFLQGGSEILRSKQGDHNSYKSGDEINAIHWKDKLEYYDVFNYYKGLIDIRKNHPAFRMRTALDVRTNQHVYFARNDDRSGVIISHIRNHANGDAWENIVVIYNGTTLDNYDVNNSLPQSNSGKWNIVVNHDRAGIEIIKTVEQGRVPSLKSHSMMIIYE